MTAPRWLRTLLERLRSWWERPDPMAALESIEHRQAVDLLAAVQSVEDDDFEALARIHELTAGTGLDCPVCAEVFRIADERIGGELS